MPYNETAPDENQSVKANKSILQTNTTYVKEKLELDHYWGPDDNTAGRHNIIHSSDQETDPIALPNIDIDGATYLRQKTNAESPSNEDVQPFFMNLAAGTAVPNVAQYLQLLGMRACFLADIALGGAITVKYSHNVAIARNSIGNYTATFTNSLPSDDYLVLGDCTGRVVTLGAQLSDLSNFRMLGAASAPNKTNALFKFGSYTSFTGSISVSDPESIWFVVFGG